LQQLNPYTLLSHQHPPRTTYTDPHSVTRTWESCERLTRPKGSDIDGVGIVAILQDPKNPDVTPQLVLQKQWRPPIDAVVVEVPAGLIDPKESAEECALRELKEETGYIGVVVEGDFGVSGIMFNGKRSINFQFKIEIHSFSLTMKSYTFNASSRIQFICYQVLLTLSAYLSPR
jgi:8-oxo-dGTP pyrophosphatase MutT (NUDIX family)